MTTETQEDIADADKVQKTDEIEFPQKGEEVKLSKCPIAKMCRFFNITGENMQQYMAMGTLFVCIHLPLLTGGKSHNPMKT